MCPWMCIGWYIVVVLAKIIRTRWPSAMRNCSAPGRDMSKDWPLMPQS